MKHRNLKPHFFSARLCFLLLIFPFLASSQPYFQQEVNYTIEVKLDDVKHELSATERIEYINHSPHALPVIYMHVWPNAYKNNSTALAEQLVETGKTGFYYAQESERGFIDQLDFKVDDRAVKWEFLKDSIDICILYLNEPLAPGARIIITTPFHVKIPSGKFSRLGHIGQSYQITQWYPKPAVYDRNGWNPMPYLNQGEFYSEFGSFDVSITLPRNYVLGATGDLTDAEEEIEWLHQKVKETEAISSFDENSNDFPPSDTAMKTLRLKQSNVHDFAWFCDKRFHVLKGEVETPHTKHKVTTWVMFTNTKAHLWKNSIQYMNDAIYYYSLWNGDYPYNHCTAVDGTISAGGGMEYPNITVIGNAVDRFLLDVVITHEVGHNWFYGMLGSNERMHPWMDEGLNSFHENRYIETKYPDARLAGGFALSRWGKLLDIRRYKHKAQYELSYLYPALKNEDQPIVLPADEFTELNYGGIVYSKTALAFDYLMAYIGEKEMDKAMQAYFKKWHFKHPQPSDLRQVFEESTGKDLRWFFDDLLSSTKKLDYKISFAHQNDDSSWDLGVKNTGEINGPVIIQGIKNKKLIGEVTYDGFSGKQALSFPPADIDYFQIDFLEDMPEVNRNNNIIRTSGAFKKLEPPKLQFLGSLDNPTRSQLFFIPVIGWNNYNRWMPGILLYNHLFPQKKFEFELMPMLSYSTNDFSGYGHFAYHMFPAGPFQRISVGGTATRYAYSNDPFDMNFNKLAPELNIEFRKKRLRSPFTHSIRYRNISIILDSYTGNYDFSPPVYGRDTLHLNYNVLSYQLKKSDAISPYKITIDLQQGQKMMKASLTAKYSYHFRKKNKGFDLRFFAGSFVGTEMADAGPYRFRMSGWRGYHDYLYDHVFLGRTETEGILGAQFAEEDGAFKFYSPVGQSAKWLSALNFRTSLGNLRLPLSLYADLGVCEYDGRLNDAFLYNAGLIFSFRKDIFEVFFPVLISKDLEGYKKANGLSYGETIRFTLNLNLVNPFLLLREFEL